MAVYRTVSGDVLDAICKAAYGRESAIVAVLEANQGLAARGPVLPDGITVILPEIPAPADVPTTRLWT